MLLLLSLPPPTYLKNSARMTFLSLDRVDVSTTLPHLRLTACITAVLPVEERSSCTAYILQVLRIYLRNHLSRHHRECSTTAYSPRSPPSCSDAFRDTSCVLGDFLHVDSILISSLCTTLTQSGADIERPDRRRSAEEACCEILPWFCLPCMLGLILCTIACVFNPKSRDFGLTFTNSQTWGKSSQAKRAVITVRFGFLYFRLQRHELTDLLGYYCSSLSCVYFKQLHS